MYFWLGLRVILIGAHLLLMSKIWFLGVSTGNFNGALIFCLSIFWFFGVFGSFIGAIMTTTLPHKKIVRGQ